MQTYVRGMVKLGLMVKTYFVSNNVENILIQFAVHIEAIKSFRPLKNEMHFH